MDFIDKWSMCFNCWKIYVWGVWSWIFLRCQLSQVLTAFAGLVYLSDFLKKFLLCQLLRLKFLTITENLPISFQFFQCLIHAIKSSLNKQNAKLQILYVPLTWDTWSSQMHRHRTDDSCCHMLRVQWNWKWQFMGTELQFGKMTNPGDRLW